jgi:glyoxylase-like metal-dependent hydrolase (beta-lactamase superfamily II)
MPVQLFDQESSTYSYLLIDPASREAVLIDPVEGKVERDLEALKRHAVRLAWVLETHAHADHVTGSGKLRDRTGALAAAPSGCMIAPADRQLQDGEEIFFGRDKLKVIHTPGHTAGSMSYVWHDNVFTGDALFIGGCGRTDFQGGDAGALYDSITGRLFSLPEETRVWPGHDYKGNTMSTIGVEKRTNPRLAGKSREEFIALMGALDLPKPRLIDVAVPANRNLGLSHGV